MAGCVRPEQKNGKLHWLDWEAKRFVEVWVQADERSVCCFTTASPIFSKLVCRPSYYKFCSGVYPDRESLLRKHGSSMNISSKYHYLALEMTRVRDPSSIPSRVPASNKVINNQPEYELIVFRTSNRITAQGWVGFFGGANALCGLMRTSLRPSHVYNPDTLPLSKLMSQDETRSSLAIAKSSSSNNTTYHKVHSVRSDEFGIHGATWKYSMKCSSTVSRLGVSKSSGSRRTLSPPSHSSRNSRITRSLSAKPGKFPSQLCYADIQRIINKNLSWPTADHTIPSSSTDLSQNNNHQQHHFSDKNRLVKKLETDLLLANERLQSAEAKLIEICHIKDEVRETLRDSIRSELVAEFENTKQQWKVESQNTDLVREELRNNIRAELENEFEEKKETWLSEMRDEVTKRWNDVTIKLREKDEQITTLQKKLASNDSSPRPVSRCVDEYVKTHLTQQSQDTLHELDNQLDILLSEANEI